MQKTNERGAIMVEVIAVLALLGTMGTVLFRQMVQRNEELENVNLASEMRIMKEALTAYIQADKAYLTSICGTASANKITDCLIAQNTIAEKISFFVPDGYADTVDSYNFYVYTYILDPNIAPRQVFYGMIFPKGIDEDDSPLPSNMNLLRAARIASLVGAEGGVYYGDEETTGNNIGSKMVHGTLGGWELDCPDDAAACPDDEPMYAAITGTDVFIPEAEQPEAPKAKVALPESVAFSRLHSYDYFSVGDGTKNCVELCSDAQGKPILCHALLGANGKAQDDTIYEPGYQGCDPLFWVGSQNNQYNTSTKGQVYVKNNLYIGRNNQDERHAVAIERDDTNGNNQIRVYDPTGKERLTLNSNGQIIARDKAAVETIRIDGEKGEITLNERIVDVNFNGKKATIAVPTVIIGSNGIKMDGMTIHNNGLIEAKEAAAFYDGNNLVNTTYRLDPAYTSLMNDIRLTSRGGARLSDILPNYIMQNVSTHQFNDNKVTSWEVDKPTCPTGYAKAIIVTPTAWSQYVKNATLHLGSDITGTAKEKQIGSNASNHTHEHDVVLTDYILSSQDLLGGPNIILSDLPDSLNGSPSGLYLEHRGAVTLQINEVNGDWEVTAKYNDGPASGLDPITVMAQTYCVFDKTNFTSGSFNKDMQGNYNYDYDTSSSIAAGVGIMDSLGTKSGYRSSGTITSKECTDNNDCSITSYCNSKKCTELGGPCTANDNPPTGSNAQCIEGQWLSISCVDDSDCNDTSIKCIGYRCISTPTP